jgi:dTDP-4-dehydrorhamnose reductase
VLWERTTPRLEDQADWRWADARLTRARALGFQPIVTLVHHGSGPVGTDLLDPDFPERLADYARAVAERYPWIPAYTPVNEPLTTARFSALYGLWYPHARSDQDFIRAVLNQCRGSILAMRAVREVNPEAIFVQTEDLGRAYSTAMLAYQANFDNDRRWLSFDLLTGRLSPADRLWRYMRHLGFDEGELHWFRSHACPPDILGINHYLTSNRYLDTDLDRYPAETWGGNGRHRYADVAAVRVVDSPPGHAELLEETWQRYRRAVAVTEVHLGCTREEQVRWLRDAWEAAHAARDRGVDVRAVTAWALLGAFDWDSLLTRTTGHYEPGAFDVRGPVPRVTAVGRLIGELAAGRQPSPAIAEGPGWWRRPIRLAHGHDYAGTPGPRVTAAGRPVLVAGVGGVLARAFDHAARLRGLEIRMPGRTALNLTDGEAVAAALDAYRPWAVIDATSCAFSPETCPRWSPQDADAAARLAAACRERSLPLAILSSDLVFGGPADRPRLESAEPNPATAGGAPTMQPPWTGCSPCRTSTSSSTATT